MDFDEPVPKECPRCKYEWGVSWNFDEDCWECSECGAKWNKDTCLVCGFPEQSCICVDKPMVVV